MTPCAGCESAIEPKLGRGNPRRWCSEACRVKSYYQRNPERLEQRRRSDRERKPRVDRKPCENCGERVVKNRVDFRYCGKVECKKRAARERAGKTVQARRARLAGVASEAFLPREVFERDEWVCGICELDVDPSLRFPDPGSPSLDHVVPLSRGGPHTRENTRLAHLFCNLCKGNRVA